MVNVFEEGWDNYTVRKEYNSKWSSQFYRIGSIEHDEVGNKISN